MAEKQRQTPSKATGDNGADPEAKAPGRRITRSKATARRKAPWSAELRESSWAPVDLGPIITGIEKGEIVGPRPSLLPRTDGQCLLYPGEIHSFSGEPDIGKGWVILSACADAIGSGRHVLYLDFEDGPASIVERLLALGVTPEAITKYFHYIRPSDPLDDEFVTELLKAHTYTLAVVDGLTEAYELLGLDPLSNKDATKFLRRLPRPIARSGAAVVEIDHVNRNPEQRGRYAIGAQHKLAGVTAGFSVRAVPGRALNRQTQGQIKIGLSKDRHGHIGKHGPIALVLVTPENNGQRVIIEIGPPDGWGSDGEFRPTHLMEKTSKAIEETPGMTVNGVRAEVRGNNDAGADALKLLIKEGYVEVRPKLTRSGREAKQGHTHHHIKPYTEALG